MKEKLCLKFQHQLMKAQINYGFTMELEINKRYKGFQQALLAPKSGIFLPNPEIKFLTMMNKNDHIATIIDYYGNELCKLSAPEDGMIFGLRALPNVTIGEWCCFFAIIEGEW